MPQKHKNPLKAARKAVRRTKRRDVFKELRDYLRSQPRIVSLPAPPGTIEPARWVGERDAAKWRREFARNLKAGKQWKPSGEGGMTLREYAEREYPHTNDICLADDMTLVRLVGVARDPYDLYHVEQDMRGKRRYVSAVGRCDSLRGALRADLYERVDRMFRLNGCKPVKRMLILRETRAPIRPRSRRK